MTLNRMASVIAKREGKKSQVKVGDVREILRILVDLEQESASKASPIMFICRELVRREVPKKKKR